MDARKKNPEASNLELCDEIYLLYGETITKSGMKHRMSKIKELANAFLEANPDFILERKSQDAPIKAQAEPSAKEDLGEVELDEIDELEFDLQNHSDSIDFSKGIQNGNVLFELNQDHLDHDLPIDSDKSNSENETTD